jgi:hypothetical protein
MHNDQITALDVELNRYNSRLVDDESNGKNILTADVDGTLISESKLLDFLNRYSIPFQEITFRYRIKKMGSALQGRYWAYFHK